ncbi:hypothetical protein MQE23_00025 [Streptomyces sp. HP-A2021]|uniref:hypothetical protein n=1 Tax=Streptomyces sp. HP-A2021 TaxID=2927875 RepID=UPI001FAF5B66|nr:hypothetical protein [Streptomyces sp. HP-A2021]UOB07600.1 hypothetical protein MQE23_00025 [Streptomyces sp. HP-A2021]
MVVRQVVGSKSFAQRLVNDGLLELSVLSATELLPNMRAEVVHWQRKPEHDFRYPAVAGITAPDDMTFNLDGEPLSAKTLPYQRGASLAIHCRLPPQCSLLE